MVLDFLILLVLFSGRRSTFMFYFIFVKVCRRFIFMICWFGVYSRFLLWRPGTICARMRDHLCSYEGTICAQFILADFLSPCSGRLQFCFREWVLFLFFFIAIFSCVCVYQYFFFTDVFKSDIWTEFFASFPVHLQPLASVVRLCVLNCACLPWRF